MCSVFVKVFAVAYLWTKALVAVGIDDDKYSVLLI